MGYIYKYVSCNWILSAEKRIPMFLDVYEDANWALMLPEQMSLGPEILHHQGDHISLFISPFSLWQVYIYEVTCNLHT